LGFWYVKNGVSSAFLVEVLLVKVEIPIGAMPLYRNTFLELSKGSITGECEQKIEAHFNLLRSYLCCYIMKDLLDS
jgi:hypothetical protein